MNTSLTATILLCLAGLMCTLDASGQNLISRKKLGQTGMQFLSVSVDARMAAMGDAATALEGSSIALFYNPAGLAGVDRSFDVTLGRNQWISEIEYNYGSIAYRPAGGRYGTIGVSLLSVGYGDLTETIRSEKNSSGYEKVGTFSPSALAAGFGYAVRVTDRFSVGGQVKYVRQSLGSAILSLGGSAGMSRENLAKSTAAFDFGVIYWTGFRSLRFAMSARNFAGELTYAEESFELPLAFRIGMSMNLMDFMAHDAGPHSFLLAVDAMHPRDNVEQISIGGEYMFMNLIALRAGYMYPAVEQGINLGAGLRQSFGGIGFAFDYGFSEFGLFGNVHRVALRLAME